MGLTVLCLGSRLIWQDFCLGVRIKHTIGLLVAEACAMLAKEIADLHRRK